MTEGTLVAWKKKKGDKVSTGRSDRRNRNRQGDDGMGVARRRSADGDLYRGRRKGEVGEKIAFIGDEGEEAPASNGERRERRKRSPRRKSKSRKRKRRSLRRPKKQEKETAPPEEKTKEPAEAERKKPKPHGRPTTADEARVKASPLARRWPAELGVDVSQIKGTGPEGRVTETDVRAAAKSAERRRRKSNSGRKATHFAKPGEGARIQL